jgi:hypothetical protein
MLHRSAGLTDADSNLGGPGVFWATSTPIADIAMKDVVQIFMVVPSGYRQFSGRFLNKHDYGAS